MLRKLYLIVITIIIIIITGCDRQDEDSFRIVNGVLDLSDWDREKDPIIKIKGDMEFYWKKLIDPASYRLLNESEMTGFIKTPGTWKNFKIHNKKIGHMGYATYRFKVINGTSSGTPLALYIPSIYTSYKLWINDKLFVENGKVGVAREYSRPRQYSQLITMDSTYESFTVTIQVSNFYDIIAGICYAPLIGEHKAIYRKRSGYIIADSLLTGVIFIIALYNLWFYIFRRSDKSTLFFSLFCMIMFFGIMIMGELFFYRYSSYFMFEVIKTFNYLFFYLGFLTFSQFMYHQFKKSSSRIITIIFTVIAILYSIPTIFLPLRIHGPIMPSFQIILVISFFYFIYVMIRATLKKEEGAVLFLIGATVYFLLIILDIMRANAVIDIEYLSHFGLFVFILCQSIIIAIRFNKLYVKSDRLTQELQNYSHQLETKVVERTHELELANKELTTLTDERTTLFINLAHETKTPLTLIDNYLDKEIGTRGMNENLSVIKYNTDKLKYDMLNYLDLEKLEKNLMVYNHELIVDLSKITTDKSTMFKDYAVKKNIALKTNIEEQIHIKADPAALDRIINNLLDNAVKYNLPKGHINVSLVRTEDDGVVLSVENTGPGISKEELSHIFTPYFQVSHKKRNIQGIGMGLAIIKKVVDGMQAAIDVSSDEDGLTKFCLHLSEYKTKDNDEIIFDYTIEKPLSSGESVTLLPEEYNKSKKTLFIVEDNLQMVSYLQSSFIDDYNIYCAFNGKKALDKIQWIPVPDLIISDVMMDELDGYEFCAQIKKDERFVDIPIIFLTAKNTQDEKLKGLHLGAIDYIRKPFSFDEIQAKIKSIVIQKEQQQEANTRAFEKKIGNLLRTEPEIDYRERLDIYNLIEKEYEIVNLLIDGLENKEISDRVGISLSTVKRRIRTIFEKCGVSNRVELVNLVKRGKE